MDALKMVVLDELTLGEKSGIEKLEEFGTLTRYSTTSLEDRMKNINDHEVVITNKVIIDKEIMTECPNIKLICVAATGTNNIDLEFARQRNIEVKNVTGYSTNSVAQSVFSMLFHLLHQTCYYDNYVKRGHYAQSPIFTHLAREFWELKDKTFGIIGLGTIGKAVGKLAESFGCNVVYHSTSGKNTSNIYQHLLLDELLTTSDVISIHCPLNKNTKDLLTLQKLKLIKPGAFLINTGRGGIVNENDLAKFINEGIPGGVALDVLEREPIIPDHKLLQVNYPERLLITPHIAWTSKEAKEKLVNGIYSNIKDWLS